MTLPNVRRSRALIAASFALLAVAAGCDAVLGLNEKTLRADVPSEAPADASVVDDAEAAAPVALDASCSDMGIPPRPATDDDAGEVGAIILAFHQVDFEGRVRGRPNETIGLNLDLTCTCPGPESCRPRQADAGHCDLAGSIDNEGSGLFMLYSTAHATPLDDVVNAQIALGNFTVLLEITGYNGQANDGHVVFSFFTSTGTPRADGGARQSPLFDGNDTWEIDPSSVLGGANAVLAPKYRADAYVADHKLVAQFGDFPIPFGAGSGIGIGLSFHMSLSGLVVTAMLRSDDAGGYRIDDGLLAGRWSTQSILASLGSLPDQTFPGKVCENPDSFNALRSIVCNAADIAADPAHDRAEPPWGCDAVSVAMKFDGTAAVLGAVGESAEAGALCNRLGNGLVDDCK
jgi:hypothetical protein